MNGRVYDPELGRFMSADPYIQAPYNSQSYNRYSYVFNNPLSFVDPSGFTSKPIERVDVVCDAACQNAARRAEAIDLSNYAWYAHTNYANEIAIQAMAGFLISQASLAGGSMVWNGNVISVAGTWDTPVGGAKTSGGSSGIFDDLVETLLKTLKGVKGAAKGVNVATLALTATKVGDATLREDRKPHRGRFQAQGGKVNESVPWDQFQPLTKAEARMKLQELKDKLTDKQLAERQEGFVKAERFVNRVPLGGIHSGNYSMSRLFPPNENIRVDIEIRAGSAFTGE